MIRFILPALLLLVASCQAPQKSKSEALALDATEAQTAAMSEDCAMAGTGACEDGGDCPMKAACDAGVSACGDSCDMKADKAAMEGCDMEGDMEGCDMKGGEAAMEGCDMKGDKAAMEGCDMKGDKEGCDMKGGEAAMSEDCAMSGTGACEDGGDCPMKAACDAGVSACGDSCDMKGDKAAMEGCDMKGDKEGCDMKGDKAAMEGCDMKGAKAVKASTETTAASSCSDEPKS